MRDTLNSSFYMHGLSLVIIFRTKSLGLVELYSVKNIRVHMCITFGAFEKLRKATISFVKSVHLHGTTRLPLDGFS